jgi:hypothetical protein
MHQGRSGINRSRSHRLEHADRQHHGVEPRELEAPLELVGGLVVEEALVPPLLLEHELPGLRWIDYASLLKVGGKWQIVGFLYFRESAAK